MLKALLQVVSGKAMDVSLKPSSIQPVVVVDPVTRSPPLELSDVTIDEEKCGSG